MMFILFFILIVAIALSSVNHSIRHFLYSRISPIIFIFAAVLIMTAVYIQSIGSGIGIYSGLLLSHILFYLLILIISFIFIKISTKGYLGLRLQKYCQYSSITEYIFMLLTISVVILFTLQTIHTIISSFIDLNCVKWMVAAEPTTTSKSPSPTSSSQDPVRWWPSGVPQTWGIIGSAGGAPALAYRGRRSPQGSPRVKVAAALATIGVSIPIVVFNQAVENPNGFNRLMYSWLAPPTYKKTGNWPLSVPENINLEELYKTIDTNKSSETVKSISSSIDSSSSFLPDFNIIDLIYNLFNKIIPDHLIQGILDFFRPVAIEGYLDDLIGQQLFIHMLLFIVAISVLVLFTIFIFSMIFLQNKDFILNKFSNKYLKFYIKYQLILARISSFFLPALIALGLIELIIGHFYLLTHPIPYENLPVDLHIFIKK